MLISYFITSFFYYTSLFFAILVGIFASCNIFIRLPLIHDVFSIPVIVWTMLPLVALFALPIATCLAVAVTINQHKMSDELLIFSFLKPAGAALTKAVLIFAGLMSLVYVLLVFQFAPQSYHRGKMMLLKAAQEHLLKLEPNKFHTPFSSFTFFFKRKEKASPNKTLFQSLFLVFAPKKQHEEYFLFTARQGFFSENRLVLSNGSIHTFKSGRWHSAVFGQTDIDINQFIDAEKNKSQLTHFKFLTWDRLFNQAKTEKEAFVELHKRIAQTLWLFVLILVIFFVSLVLTSSSLLSGIVLSGAGYLVSSVFIALGQVYYQQQWLVLIIFYTPLVLVLGLNYWLYKKKTV